MKIASTLTNTTPNETGLPSLLSCGPNTVGQLSDAKLTSGEVRKPDLAEAGQSVATFAAILAMFNVPPTVPQNLPQPPQPIAVSTSDSATSASAATTAEDSVAAINLVTQSCATMQVVVSDIALPRSSPAVIAVEMPPKTTSIANALNQSQDAVAATSVIPIPAVGRVNGTTDQFKTTSSMTGLPTQDSSPSVSDASNQGDVPSDGVKSSFQDTLMQESTFADDSQIVGDSTAPAVAMPRLLIASESKLAVPTSRLESRSNRNTLNSAATSDDSTTEDHVAVISKSPVFSGALEGASNSQAVRDLPEASRRWLSLRYETADETPVRHRHGAAEPQLAVDQVNSTNSSGELADSGVQKLNVAHLTEQVSEAMQTHGSEIATGQPVEVHLRLDPPELGTVRVHLRLSDDGVSVRFIVGDEAVTKLLESQLPDLRQSLAERGLAFAQCNVSCDSRQQQQSSSSERESDLPSFVSKPIPKRSWTRTPIATRSINNGSGRIDILA